MKRTTLALFWALSMALVPMASGCVAGIGLQAGPYPGTLVEISPGVWVVSNYSEPVFYATGSYWWWNGTQWYSSRYVDTRYRPVQVRSVPTFIQNIQQPRTYVNYPPQGPTRPIPPGHVRQPYPPPPGGGPGGPGGPGGGPGGPGGGGPRGPGR